MRACTRTLAGLAVRLQLEAAVAVAGGPVEGGDTVVLAAQMGTLSSLLCGEGQVTHAQAPRPGDHTQTAPLPQPFSAHLPGLQGQR